MSGLDPAAALAAQAQVLLAEIALTLDAATLAIGVRVGVGDVLTATVLPPQGGSDFVEILGQTIPAQLPPGIDPGESIAVTVTQIIGNRIMVCNLGSLPTEAPPDSQTSPGAAPVPAPVPASASAPAPAPMTPLRSDVIPPTVLPRVAYAPPKPNLAPPAPGSLSPESVAQNLDIEARLAAQATTRPPNQALPGSATPTPAGTPNQPMPATARAGTSGPTAQTQTSPEAGSPPQPPSIPGLPALAALGRRFVPPPSVMLRDSEAPPAQDPQPLGLPAEPGAALGSPPQGPAMRLLASLDIAPSAAALAAARSSDGAVAALPQALARLDALLAQVPDQPSLATLRTMLAFVSQIDPGNERALPEQIAAFVANVLEGPEQTLASIVRALQGASQESTPAAHAPLLDARIVSTTPAFATPETGSSGSPAPAASPSLPNVPLSAEVQARSVERMAALAQDLKTAIAAIAQRPPAGAPPGLASAANAALATMTAAQLGTLTASTQDPSTFALSLPIFFRDGGRPAQIRVDREAPGATARLDADNFHIAFILDTKSLGTLAIDLRTVGRRVSIDVKTERESFAQRMHASLGSLRERLEGMRYHVASAAAAVAARVLKAPAENASITARTKPSGFDAHA